LLFKANEILAAQHFINEHTKRGLVETAKDEKKKRQREKKLNVLRQKDHSHNSLVLPLLSVPKTSKQQRQLKQRQRRLE
jgi:hypothetical protein